MRIIAWRVGPKNPALLNLGAVFGAMLIHVCCWGPILLVPLGFGGASFFLQTFIESYKPYIYLIPISMLVMGGWGLYKKPQSHWTEKVVFIVSVILVSAVIIF